MVVPGPSSRLKPAALPTRMTKPVGYLTGVRSRMEAQDASYFADLGRPSPAADAPPNQVREFASSHSSPRSSVRPSLYSSESSSWLPMRPQPAQTTLSHASARWNAAEQASVGSPRPSTSMSRQSGSEMGAEVGGRAESTGLEFLFNVWQHNPQHTPRPDNVHA